jgi:UDP-N-acetylglucosamine pyrophosphorylase
MNFIQIFGNAIPPLRHYLEVRFIRKRRNMELPIMRNKKSATTTTINK